MLCICTSSIQSAIIRVHDMITRGCLHRTMLRIPCAQYTNSGILKINYLCYKALIMRPDRCVKEIYEDNLALRGVEILEPLTGLFFLANMPQRATVSVLCFLCGLDG